MLAFSRHCDQFLPELLPGFVVDLAEEAFHTRPVGREPYGLKQVFLTTGQMVDLVRQRMLSRRNRLDCSGITRLQ